MPSFKYTVGPNPLEVVISNTFQKSLQNVRCEEDNINRSPAEFQAKLTRPQENILSIHAINFAAKDRNIRLRVRSQYLSTRNLSVAGSGTIIARIVDVTLTDGPMCLLERLRSYPRCIHPRVLEQAFDLAAALDGIGGVCCLLIENSTHLAIITSRFCETL